MQRAGGVVDLVHHSRQLLQIHLLPSQLALVRGGERRRAERNRPQGAQVEHRQLLEGAVAGERCNRVLDCQQPRPFRVRNDHVEERVPGGDLQAGPIRAQERHGDDMGQDQESQRALCPSRHVGRPRKEDAVQQQGQAHQQKNAVAPKPAGEARESGRRQVEKRCAGQRSQGDLANPGEGCAGQRDEQRDCGPGRSQVAEPLRKRRQVRLDGAPRLCPPARHMDRRRPHVRRTSSDRAEGEPRTASGRSGPAGSAP